MDEDNAMVELITFSVSGHHYAVEISEVCEIRRWEKMSEVPHCPKYVYGLLNLRGTVLPVLDLAERLGLGETTATPRHVNIVIETEGRTIGLLVDSVSNIATVLKTNLSNDAISDNAEYQNLITGFFQHEDNVVKLLNTSGLAN